MPLDSMCKIMRSEGSLTFELVTAKRTYYLTAESSVVMEEWIRGRCKDNQLSKWVNSGVGGWGWVLNFHFGMSVQPERSENRGIENGIPPNLES